MSKVTCPYCGTQFEDPESRTEEQLEFDFYYGTPKKGA